jgi:hypothetical protein
MKFNVFKRFTIEAEDREKADSLAESMDGSTIGIVPFRNTNTELAHKSDKKPQKWPFWAETLRKFVKPEDIGIGDVVARIIGAENSAAFKAWYLATFGKPCGCTGRQILLNRKYPLHQSPSPPRPPI